MTRSVHILAVGGALAASVACGDPEIVVPEVMTVDFYPPNGSVEISVNVQGLVAFSHEVADTDAAAADIELKCVGTPDAATGCRAPVGAGCPTPSSVTVAFGPAGMEARITPASALQTNTCYVYSVAGGIEAAAAHVGPLPSDRRSVFQTH